MSDSSANEYETPYSSMQCCKHCIKRKQSFLTIFCFLQFFLILFLAFGHKAKNILISQDSNTVIDPYWKLWDYNSTFFFYGLEGSANNTQANAQLWSDIQLEDGIVAVDSAWARAQGAAASNSHPAHPELSVYQVDVYHALHCLYRVRNRIVSHLSMEELRRDDPHTLHCIDYVREQLMCHADTTLQATSDYVHYHYNNGHKCRDFSAIQEWVDKHKWPEHRVYIDAWLSEHRDEMI
ncbi:hypothetical protein Trisim1_004647 [Trichoderma cf. simile WF8]